MKLGNRGRGSYQFGAVWWLELARKWLRSLWFSLEIRKAFLRCFCDASTPTTHKHNKKRNYENERRSFWSVSEAYPCHRWSNLSDFARFRTGSQDAQVSVSALAEEQEGREVWESHEGGQRKSMWRLLSLVCVWVSLGKNREVEKRGSWGKSQGKGEGKREWVGGPRCKGGPHKEYQTRPKATI